MRLACDLKVTIMALPVWTLSVKLGHKFHSSIQSATARRKQTSKCFKCCSASSKKYINLIIWDENWGRPLALYSCISLISFKIGFICSPLDLMYGGKFSRKLFFDNLQLWTSRNQSGRGHENRSNSEKHEDVFNRNEFFNYRDVKTLVLFQGETSQRWFIGTIAGDYNRQHSVNRRKSPAIMPKRIVRLCPLGRAWWLALPKAICQSCSL